MYEGLCGPRFEKGILKTDALELLPDSVGGGRHVCLVRPSARRLQKWGGFTCHRAGTNRHAT